MRRRWLPRQQSTRQRALAMPGLWSNSLFKSICTAAIPFCDDNATEHLIWFLSCRSHSVRKPSLLRVVLRARCWRCLSAGVRSWPLRRAHHRPRIPVVAGPDRQDRPRAHSPDQERQVGPTTISGPLCRRPNHPDRPHPTRRSASELIVQRERARRLK